MNFVRLVGIDNIVIFVEHGGGTKNDEVVVDVEAINNEEVVVDNVGKLVAESGVEIKISPRADTMLVVEGSHDGW